MNAKKKTGLATASLVFGIISILTVLIFINYIFALFGLLFAIIYLLRKGEKPAKGRAIAGLVCTLLSIIVSTCLWYGIYNFVMNTDIMTLAEQVEQLTDGQIDIEATINEAIDGFIVSLSEDGTFTGQLEAVEKLLGKELNYQTLRDFMGEEITVNKIRHFVGKGIDMDELANIITNVDYNAIRNDLGNDFTFKALEEKLGENFTYTDLLDYLKTFQ